MDGQCEKVEKLIVAYVLRGLDRPDSELVEQHARSCPRCSEALAEAQRIVSVVSEQEMVEPEVPVCDSVREAVRESIFGRATARGAVAALAGSFVRRPLLAGASALVLVAAVALLFVIPALRAPEGPSGKLASSGRAGESLRKVEYPIRILHDDYFADSLKLMRLIRGPRAREILMAEEWDFWFSQAVLLKREKRFEAQRPLLSDLEYLYKEMMNCEGKFEEEEIGRIRDIITQKNLVGRTEEAASARR